MSVSEATRRRLLKAHTQQAQQARPQVNLPRLLIAWTYKQWLLATTACAMPHHLAAISFSASHIARINAANEKWKTQHA